MWLHEYKPLASSYEVQLPGQAETEGLKYLMTQSVKVRKIWTHYNHAPNTSKRNGAVDCIGHRAQNELNKGQPAGA
jgi:hypothetical protein